MFDQLVVFTRLGLIWFYILRMSPVESSAYEMKRNIQWDIGYDLRDTNILLNQFI